MSESRSGRMPTMMGRTIDGGRYRVDALIGEGGMGQIYVGRQTSVNRRVALKFLHASLADDPGLLARFEREARSISRLRHPNIISLIDHGRTEDERLFMVMELLGGESLATRLRRMGALPVGTVLHIASQVASALVEAHADGIIHRDLKPDNIHLDEVAQDPNFVKVLDFGIAKMVEGPNTLPPQTPLTLAGAVFGTPQYMSPEQVTGRPIDHRSDLYAMGMILFEMLTGKVPFDGPTPSAVLVRQATDPLPDLGTIVPDLDHRLVALVNACAEKKVDDRMGSAEALLEQIRAIAVDYPNPTDPVSRPALGTRDTAETLGCAPTIFPNEIQSPGVTQAAQDTSDWTPPAGASPIKMWTALILLVGVVAFFVWPDTPPSVQEDVTPTRETSREAPAAEAPTAPSLAQKPDAATPKTAWLRLESTPPGAKVFHRGEQLGATPMEWRPTLVSDPITVRFEHPGHTSAETLIRLSPAGMAATVVTSRLEPHRKRTVKKRPPKSQKRRSESRKPKRIAPAEKQPKYQKL